MKPSFAVRFAAASFLFINSHLNGAGVPHHQCYPHFYIQADSPVKARLRLPYIPVPVTLGEQRSDYDISIVHGWAVGTIPQSSDGEESFLVVDDHGDQHVVPVAATDVDSPEVSTICTLGDYRPQQRRFNCLAVALWHVLKFYKDNGHSHIEANLDEDFFGYLDRQLGIEGTLRAALSTIETRRDFMIMMGRQDETLIAITREVGLPLVPTRSLETLRRALKSGHRAILHLEVEPTSNVSPDLPPKYARRGLRRSLRIARALKDSLTDWSATTPYESSPVDIWIGGKRLESMTNEEMHRFYVRYEIAAHIAETLYRASPATAQRQWTFWNLSDEHWDPPFTEMNLSDFLIAKQSNNSVMGHSVVAHGLITNGGEEATLVTDYRKRLDGPKTRPLSLKELRKLAWSASIVDPAIQPTP